MPTKTVLCLSFAALATMMTAGPASSATLADYDVNKAETWADALAICDVTKFLMSEPKLDSEVIIAATPTGSPVALHRPYYIPPSSFYSEVMKDTFDKAVNAGQVNFDSYSAARLRYAKQMLSAYGSTTGDKAFLADQMRLCYALAADASRWPQTAKRDKAH